MPPPNNGRSRKLNQFNPAERIKRIGKIKEQLFTDLRFLHDTQSDAMFVSSKRDRQPIDSPSDPEKDKPSPIKKTKVSSTAIFW